MKTILEVIFGGLMLVVFGVVDIFMWVFGTDKTKKH